MSADLIEAITNWAGEFWVAIPLLFGLTWFLVLMAGRPFISVAQRLQAKHSSSSGAPPFFGGVLVIGSALLVFAAAIAALTTLFLVQPGSPPPPLTDILTFLAQFFLFPTYVGLSSFLGTLDDQSESRGKPGLHPWLRFSLQSILTYVFLAVAYYLSIHVNWGPYPFLRSLFIYFDNSNSLIALALIIVCASNAVNAAGSLDGLAAGLSLQWGLVLLLVGEGSWNSPETSHMEVTLFWAALAGACLAFLAYNKPAAKIRLGSSGGLALGAALGAGVLLNGDLALLPFIGFIFLVELLTIPAQRGYSLLTMVLHGEARPLFRGLPLHRHLQLAGWSTWRILITFWLVNLVTSIIGLVLWQGGLLPQFP